MSQLASTISKDFTRSCLLVLAVAFVVIPLGCLCVFIPLTIAGSPSVDDNTGLLLLIVSLCLFMGLIFGGGLLAAAGIVMRRNRWLDSVFTPLGLNGEAHLLQFRQYRGQVEGRPLHVRFSRGPHLTLAFDTSLQTRLDVGARSKLGMKLSGWMNREPVHLDDPDLADLVLFADDETWLRKLLSWPETRAALLRLMTAPNGFLLSTLNLQPGRLTLRRYRNTRLFKIELAPEEAKAWTDDMLSLLNHMEALPAPTPPTDV